MKIIKTKDYLNNRGEKIGHILSIQTDTAKEQLVFSNAVYLHTEYQTEFEKFLEKKGIDIDKVLVSKNKFVGESVITDIILYNMQDVINREFMKNTLTLYINNL